MSESFGISRFSLPLIVPYRGVMPKIHPSAFIAPTAVIIGDVEVGEYSSIWYGCRLRGDVNAIRIGARTNIQDGSVLHGSSQGRPVIVGADVTVGHGAILHACTVENGAFIGIGAVLLDGVIVRTGAMVAAGALVTPGKLVLSSQLWAGRPAKAVRELTQQDRQTMAQNVQRYVELARDHRQALEALAQKL